MTRMVVLDGYTLNPGDLEWAGLEALGTCAIYDRTPAEQTVARAAGADIVLTNKTVLSAEVIRQLPALRYIGVLATGYNVVDIAAAREQGIVVTHVPAYSTASVAQMVFAHIFHHTQRVAHHAQTVRDGRWSRSADFCYWDAPLVELAAKTLGIVGLGRIGQATARIAQALGMEVIAFAPRRETSPMPGVHLVSLDEVFARSDVLSLHCPLTPDTEHLVNRERLALMKRTALLINTSRGPLVHEVDLADALDRGALGGAGLDVIAEEPPPADHPLFHARNCTITPHIAWATLESRRRLMNAAIDNVRAFLAGSPQHVIT